MSRKWLLAALFLSQPMLVQAAPDWGGELEMQITALQSEVEELQGEVVSLQAQLKASAQTFYLTKAKYCGAPSENCEYLDSASFACASGYHLASFYELLGHSSLIYDSTRGFPGTEHSTYGPPVLSYDEDVSGDAAGWVEAGFAILGGDQLNCSEWDYGGNGLVASFHMRDYILTGNFLKISEPINCSRIFRVWCVSDPINP